MKYNKLIVRLTLLFCIALIEAQGQNAMFVKDNSGNPTPFLIESLRSFTFPSGNLQINKTDGLNSIFKASDISKLYFGISNETGINLAENGIEKLQLFPNPVVNQLHVQYFSTSENQGEILIFDMQGRLVRQVKQANRTGMNYIKLDVAGLHQGMYVCRTVSGSKIEFSKFLKSN